MAYRFSNQDKKNLKWFGNNNDYASLVYLRLASGTIRGLTPFQLDFQFPIAVFAGANGTGKSTLLALAACGYHNKPLGFKLPERKNPYYTFGDFFIQSRDELPPDGIVIKYGFRHRNSKNSPGGVIYQYRKKRQGGKWSNYRDRVGRNVIYFGVQRVVPHFERSVHKSYRQRFRALKLDEHSTTITKIASRILGKNYSSFENLSHSKYSLPSVQTGDTHYTGFNMGAGETAIFEILTALFQAGEGSLLVIDEIELGLHEQAQYRLIEELKALCLQLKCQVIASTHSFAILDSLPPEARFFLERNGNGTLITQGVTAEMACGKMGKKDSVELELLVEDKFAKNILTTVVPLILKQRLKISQIGSHAAVMRQLASRRIDNLANCVAILDGDQSNALPAAKKNFLGALELSNNEQRSAASNWLNERLCFLPGTSNPEKWLAETSLRLCSDNSSFAEYLERAWRLEDIANLESLFEQALNENVHGELYQISKYVCLSSEQICIDLSRAIMEYDSEQFRDLIEQIERFLKPSQQS